MSPTRVGSDRPTATLSQRGSVLRRWLAEEDRGLLLVLVVMTVAFGIAIFSWDWVGASVLLLPLLLSSLLLPPSRVPWMVGLILVTLVLLTLIQAPDGFPVTRWSALATAFAVGAVTLAASYRRAVLGVAGMRGESMLIDLRERINRQGDLPQLPDGWQVEHAARSAGGASFAGDFMVSSVDDESGIFSVVVVDVSGKGVDVGTRSLLLAGAFGGLLGALSPRGFLPAANDFVLRQDWPEGFATAVHLSVDLRTGEFELRSAGHPPAVQWLAGAGHWEVHAHIEGPVLGITPNAVFHERRGRLAHGDAIFLFTDGLVETSSRDISMGIDRLLGEGERLVSAGFIGSAEALVRRLGAFDDDCALLILQRG